MAGGGVALGPSKNQRLRVGVIGLGRLWEARHKPALARRGDQFQIVAVYDQVGLRAELEARQIGCHAAEGLVELFDRPDVDVIYFLTPQWFGLHPLALACEYRKPIFCALPSAADPAGLESLAGMIRESGIPFMPELPRRFYPATLRLRELLATSLGPPRLVLGHARLFGFDRYGEPGPTTQLAPGCLLIDPGGNLVDWCRFVFQAEPVAVQGCGVEPDFEGLTLEFPGGGLAQIGIGRYHRSRWGEASRFLPQPGFQVFAERGAAWLEMPDRIQWTDAEGVHEERLPMEPTIGERLGEHFHRLVSGEPSLATSLDDALAVSRAVVAIRESRQQGRRIGLDPTEARHQDGPGGRSTPATG